MNFTKLMHYIVPQERKFFPMYEEAAGYLVRAAILLNKLLLIEEGEEKGNIIKQIKELEDKGDHITHTIYDELNKTFITPFDREDIHLLASTMDDVLDYINSCSQKIGLYKPKYISRYSIEISELILQAAREIETAVKELNNIKHPQKIKQSCSRLNDIEKQADDIYHHAISEFFEKEADAIELIKKNEIIQTLEKATDRAEDVSDVLKSIMIKIA